MSQSIRDFEATRVASEDLSSKQFHIVQMDASGDIEAGEGPLDFIVGVLQNAPESGQAATYRFLGTSKLVAGGVITLGDWVTAKSDGRCLTTTTDGDIVIGRALETSATDGDIIEVTLGIQHIYIA